MYKCAECGEPVARDDAVIDHIVPVTYGGTNDPSNLRLVHPTCNKALGFWARLRLRWELWRNSWLPCPKEKKGYTCRHRIMSNGMKECGKEENYWKGDDE